MLPSTEKTSSAPARIAASISAVLRLSMATRRPSSRSADRQIGLGPGFPGRTAECNQVGPLVVEAAGGGRQLGHRQPRRIADLGHDLHVVRAVIRHVGAMAKVIGKLLEVFWAALDGSRGGLFQRCDRPDNNREPSPASPHAALRSAGRPISA